MGGTPIFGNIHIYIKNGACSKPPPRFYPSRPLATIWRPISCHQRLRPIGPNPRGPSRGETRPTRAARCWKHPYTCSWLVVEPTPIRKTMRKSNWIVSPGPLGRGENTKYMKPAPSIHVTGFYMLFVGETT